MKPVINLEKQKNKAKKHTKKIIFCCMATVTLCGCKNAQEERPASLSPSPAITEASEQVEIPIDAEHFSDEIFREYISGMYDTDKNGALSQREREAVKEIIWSGTEIPMDKFTFAYKDVRGGCFGWFGVFP